METNNATLIKNTKSYTSAFNQMVEQLYETKSSTIGNQGNLSSVIGTCFASMSQTQNTWKRATFRDLLLHLAAQKCYPLLRNELYINALANMASFGNKMVRDLFEWKKESIETESIMSDLIQFCYAKYEVPEFLEGAFFGENKIHMLWYVQLGRGDSVLKLSSFPIQMTRKMAFEFKNVPANYTIEQAIRFAQAKGYGANELMAETLAWSSLSESFEHEEFWKKVMGFFANQETLPFDKLQEVLAYIKEQFNQDKNFSMKGRTWEALIRHTDQWNLECQKRKEALNRAEWKTSQIMGFEKQVTDDFYYIVELVNSEELYNEGYEMSHCVAEYEYDCIEGRSAIFSLRKQQVDATYITLATIEVCMAEKAIIQAKAKYNEYVSSESLDMINQWAKKENLDLFFDYEDENQEAYQPAVQHALPDFQMNQPQPAFQRFDEFENYQRRTDYGSEVDWKWFFYILFILVKGCAVLAR